MTAKIPAGCGIPTLLTVLPPICQDCVPHSSVVGIRRNETTMELAFVAGLPSGVCGCSWLHGHLRVASHHARFPMGELADVRSGNNSIGYWSPARLPRATALSRQNLRPNSGAA